MGFIKNLFSRHEPGEPAAVLEQVGEQQSCVAPGTSASANHWLECASLTDVGTVRSNNEDNVKLMPDPSTGLALALLADGMGGHASGELASALALETIISRYADRKASTPLVSVVREAIEAANVAVFQHAQVHPECTGMGTTVCVLAFGREAACLGWVGDSRIYLVQADQLQQLTTDDTMVNRLVAEGVLTEEQAENHPDAHVLSQALGTHDSLQHVHAISIALPQIGDTFLLTSDGVHDVLDEKQIIAIVTANDVHHGVAELIRAAKEAGSSDNLSAILVRAEPPKNRKVPLAATRY